MGKRLSTKHKKQKRAAAAKNKAGKVKVRKGHKISKERAEKARLKNAFRNY